ncbi:MAG: amidase family protein [Planctomycetaceae bacterium]|nr:amidase family protein [Planctomycetaceae bacterium]
MDHIVLEDCIMKKGHPATAGSKMLENFIAPFDATVVERLREANVEAKGTLCNDLFGQYRRMAAEKGWYYIHPTYGTVSRYGLIPLASSMDQIGILCENMADGFRILEVIAGHDARDGAMFPEKSYRYKRIEKKLTVCVPFALAGQADGFRAFAEKFTVVNRPLEYFDVYKQVMVILSCAEISNNISRYDGVKFGYRASDAKNLESLYTQSRTEAFDLKAKLAAIIGGMVLSSEHYTAWYEKAMKIRRLIRQSLRFDQYDLIALPTSVGDDPYENLSLYVLATLAGLPSVSFAYNGQGVQLIADVKNENALLTAWEMLQESNFVQNR